MFYGAFVTKPEAVLDLPLDDSNRNSASNIFTRSPAPTAIRVRQIRPSLRLSEIQGSLSWKETASRAT